MNARTPPRPPAAPEFFSADVAEARRFYLDLRPPKGRPLVVVCGGLEHCTSDYAIHRETYPFYSIEYVTVNGEGDSTLKSVTTAVRWLNVGAAKRSHNSQP
jgi:hypothetical protein